MTAKANKYRTLLGKLCMLSIGVVAMLLVSSCSKVAEGDLGKEVAQGVGQAMSVELSLPILDPEIVSEDGMRGMGSFDYDLKQEGYHLLPSLALKDGDRVEADFYIHCIKGGVESPHKMRERITGTIHTVGGRKMFYVMTEKILFPTQWDPVGSETIEYYMMAVAGGDGLSPTVLLGAGDTHSKTLHQGGEKGAKLPGLYYTDWMKLTTQSSTPTRLRPDGVVHPFKPLGAFLALRAKNALQERIPLKGFRVASNVLDFYGCYSFGQGNVGDAPSFSPSELHQADYLLDTAVEVAPGAESPYLLCWVVPRGARGLWRPQGGYSTLTTPLTRISALVEGEPLTKITETFGTATAPLNGSLVNKSMAELTGYNATANLLESRLLEDKTRDLDSWEVGKCYGYSTPVVVDGPRHALPIEALYFNDRDKGVQDWVVEMDQANPSSPTPRAMNTYAGAQSLAGAQGDVLRRTGYTLPTVEEWRVALPKQPYNRAPQGNSIWDIFFQMNFENSSRRFTIDSERITVWGQTDLYKGEYACGGTTSPRVGYGLRFQEGRDNEYLSAYRYELIGEVPEENTNRSPVRSILKVTVRHLGKERASTALATISSEAYWASQPDIDQAQAVRYFTPGMYWSSSKARNHYSAFTFRGDEDDFSPVDEKIQGVVVFPWANSNFYATAVFASYNLEAMLSPEESDGSNFGVWITDPMLQCVAVARTRR